MSLILNDVQNPNKSMSLKKWCKINGCSKLYEKFISCRIFCVNDLLKEKHKFSLLSKKVKFNTDQAKKFKIGMKKLKAKKKKEEQDKPKEEPKTFEVCNHILYTISSHHLI